MSFVPFLFFVASPMMVNMKYVGSKIFFSIMMLLLGVEASCKPLNINVHGKSAILINAESGKVLFQKNPHDKRSPASVTKIATCLTALEAENDLSRLVVCPMSQLLKISRKKKTESGYTDPPYTLEPDAMSDGIYAGEKLTIENLIYGMMLPSGDDSANVLAHHLDENGIEGFVDKMNRRIRKIGCKNTRFYNPHGLYYPGHLTTAYDIALIAKEAIKNEEFVRIVSSVKYQRPKTNKQPARMIWNSNKLLRRGPFSYSKAFGIKTGYHETARYTFTGAAKDENRTLICVTLGCESYEEVFLDAIQMFEAAFGEKKLARKLLNAQDCLYFLKVKNAKEPIKAVLKSDLVYEYYPSEEEEISPVISWNQVSMPIKKGDLLGEVQVKNKLGETLMIRELFAKEDACFSTAFKVKSFFVYAFYILLGAVFVLLMGYITRKMYRFFQNFLQPKDSILK